MPDTTDPSVKTGEDSISIETKVDPGAKKVEVEPEILDDSKYEPPVRSQSKPWSNQEERKQFFEKLHSKPKNDQEDAGDEDGEKPPITLEQVQELFTKQTEAIFQPVFDQVRSTADEAEITSFLSKSENSIFKKYERMARKDMKVYPNIPIDRIFKSLAYDDALALGAERSKQAEDKGQKNKIGGRSSRPTDVSGVPDFSTMTDKEFAEFNKGIRRGATVKVGE